MSKRYSCSWDAVTVRPDASSILKGLRKSQANFSKNNHASVASLRGKMTESVLQAIESGAKIPTLEREDDPFAVAEQLLAIAAEVEHTLMVEYLYAYFSIDQTSQFGKTHAATVLEIAIEEMGHLMTVQNLRIAIGAAPHFDLQTDPSVGTGSEEYPFPLRLVPLTKGGLATFVAAEAPVPLPSNLPEEDVSAANEAETVANSEIASNIKHVGLLYARLIWLFQNNPKKSELEGGFDADMSAVFGSGHLPPDFVFNTDGQEMPDKWPFGPGFFVASVLTRDEAITALQKIAVQGEGWDVDPDTQPSHFERFLTIWKNHPSVDSEFLLSRAQNPRLPNDPAWPSAEESEISLENQPTAVFFRTRYEILVLSLKLLLVTNNESLRIELRRHTLNSMRRPITELGQSLANAGSGAPFRLLQMLPSDENDLKAELRERFHRSKSEAANVAGNWTNVLANDDKLEKLFDNVV